jgi:hypothetical protein
MTRILAAALVALVVGGPARGADTTTNFVKFFWVNCLQTIGDLAALKTYAGMMKWKVIPKEIAAVGGGKIDTAWFVREEDQSLIIASGSGVSEDGRPYNGCSVSSKLQDADEVANILVARLKPKPLHDEIEGFQRWQAFDVRVSGVSVLVNIISADDPKVRTVVLSALHFPK